MLKLIYDLQAGYGDNPILTETGINLEISMTDFDDLKKVLPDLTPETAEQMIYLNFKDHIDDFCDQIDFNVQQDALDYCIENYFKKRVEETGEFPWVDVTNLRLESLDFAEAKQDLVTLNLPNNSTKIEITDGDVFMCQDDIIHKA